MEGHSKISGLCLYSQGTPPCVQKYIHKIKLINDNENKIECVCIAGETPSIKKTVAVLLLSLEAANAPSAELTEQGVVVGGSPLTQVSHRSGVWPARSPLHYNSSKKWSLVWWRAWWLGVTRGQEASAGGSPLGPCHRAEPQLACRRHRYRYR